MATNLMRNYKPWDSLKPSEYYNAKCNYSWNPKPSITKEKYEEAERSVRLQFSKSKGGVMVALPFQSECPHIGVDA